MIVKKLLFSLIALLVPSIGWSQAAGTNTPVAVDNPAQVLVLWQRDGSQVAYNLNDKPDVLFRDGSIVVTSVKYAVEYPFDSILKFTYEGREWDSIIVVEAEEGKLPFKADGESVLFTAADKDLSVRLVSVDGIMLREFSVAKGSTSAVSLSVLGNGVTLVDVNGVTSKILRR